MSTSVAALLLTIIVVASLAVRRRGTGDARTRRLNTGLTVAALAVALWALWSSLADHRRTPEPAPTAQTRP